MSNDSRQNVNFPRVSQILESRRDLVTLIRDEFKDEVGEGLVLFVSGSSATKAYAEVYRQIFLESWEGIRIEHRLLENAPSYEEATQVANEIVAGEHRPKLVVYVGGQTVGDVTKCIVHRMREKPEHKKVVFGGIITSLSNDGIFSVTASVRDKDGLHMSFRMEAPDFIVGHKLTLLRQPYVMKTSCVGDILAKISSLWDYNYSCRVLEKYHNDFAADLTKSAYERLLPRQSEEKISINREYLQNPESIGELFRAVQLCGLSMQLAESSETCSGSEHVGQKWLDEFIMRYNQQMGVKPEKRRPSLTHGASVIPMTITTLYLQGEAKKAEEVKKIAQAIGLLFKAKELQLPGKALQMCLALGYGFRCPRYLLHLLAGEPLPRGVLAERITILEEIEFKVLPHAIKTAMIDAGVADADDFGDLTPYDRIAMETVLEASLEHTRSKLSEIVGDRIADEIKSEIRPFFRQLL